MQFNLQFLCRYLVMLAGFPLAGQQLKDELFIRNAQALAEGIQRDLAIVSAACSNVRNCSDLDLFMNKTLAASNYLNAGTTRAEAEVRCTARLVLSLHLFLELSC